MLREYTYRRRKAFLLKMVKMDAPLSYIARQCGLIARGQRNVENKVLHTKN